MKRFFQSNTIAVGLAIFSMFFGAGNVVFPLVIGRYAGSNNFYAVIGFLLTAVGVPFLGLISMIMFDGDYKAFFSRLGKLPGSFVILASMALIGPFAAMPRCVALSFTTVQSFVPGINLFYFSLVACCMIYFFSSKKRNVIDVLGMFLSPLLLISLAVIVIKGFWSGPEAAIVLDRRREFLFTGLLEGYNTMDIFAGFFFSSVVLSGIKKRLSHMTEVKHWHVLIDTIKAGAIGISLLGLVYAGFSYVSSFYASQLAGVEPDALISVIAFKTVGPYAGILASMAVSLACLTTAIALAVVFSEFIRSEIIGEKIISYRFSLMITMVGTFAMSNVGFTRIVRIIAPVLMICYPALIVLAVFNMAHKLWGVKVVKTPVFVTFAIVLVWNLVSAFGLV